MMTISRANILTCEDQGMTDKQKDTQNDYWTHFCACTAGVNYLKCSRCRVIRLLMVLLLFYTCGYKSAC